MQNDTDVPDSQSPPDYDPSGSSRQRRITDPNHQRALDALTLSEAALKDDRAVEGGGLRSTWSPDHEFNNDMQRAQQLERRSLANLGKRVSKRITASMLLISEVANNPEFWKKLRPKERKPVGWGQSFKALVTSSCTSFLSYVHV